MNAERPLLVVGRVLGGAFALVWKQRTRFGQTLAFPLGALIASTLALSHAEAPSNTRMLLAFFMAQWILMTWLAVRCHQLVLADTAWRATQKWPWLETKFFFWSMALCLIFVMAMIAPVFIGFTVLRNMLPPKQRIENEWLTWLLLFGPMIPGAYLLARVSLVLPMVAIGRTASLSSAWALSRHNGWRLTIVVGLLPAALSAITEKLSRQNASMLEHALLAVMSAVFVVIEVVALSLSYQALTRRPTETPLYEEA